MDVDYLIIGQGISGSLLSRYLINAGKSVMVVDEFNPGTASHVAGGIINPITGMRMVRSWMIEELLPFAIDAYTAIEQELNIPLMQRTGILDFPLSHNDRDNYAAKLPEESDYLHIVGDETDWEKYFRFNYGIIMIAPCLVVDIAAFVVAWRSLLKDRNALIDGSFIWADCEVYDDIVKYKNITARKVICCEGAIGADNPYFNRLPWTRDKGEALIADIPGLPRDFVFKQGISIVPWRNGLFWIGASHDWKYTSLAPSPAFREKVEEQLNYWLKVPYKIVDHITALRPANMDRKPFVGLHPRHRAIGILNGFGGKGVSMTPHFAHNLVAHLISGSPLSPAVDVSRFTKILSR